eukprot:gene16109-22251_t
MARIERSELASIHSVSGKDAAPVPRDSGGGAGRLSVHLKDIHQLSEDNTSSQVRQSPQDAHETDRRRTNKQN